MTWGHRFGKSRVLHRGPQKIYARLVVGLDIDVVAVVVRHGLVHS
jgi:hypothetical protein